MGNCVTNCYLYQLSGGHSGSNPTINDYIYQQLHMDCSLSALCNSLSCPCWVFTYFVAIGQNQQMQRAPKSNPNYSLHGWGESCWDCRKTGYNSQWRHSRSLLKAKIERFFRKKVAVPTLMGSWAENAIHLGTTTPCTFCLPCQDAFPTLGTKIQ